MRIRTKLTLLFLFLSLIPFIIGGTVSFYNGRNALERGIGIKLSILARNTADEIDEDFFKRLRDTKSWAAAEIMDEVLIGDVDGRILGLLTSINQSYTAYSHIDCLDTQGKVVASSNIKLINQQADSSSWFKAALAGEAHISDLHQDGLPGEYVVTFSTPIRASYDRSQIIGVLASNLKLEEIHQLVGKVRITLGIQIKDEHVMLINREGLVVSAPLIEAERRNILNLNLVDIGMRSARLAVEGNEGYLVEMSEHGYEALIGYAHSKGYKDFSGLGWSVLVLQSTELAFQPVVMLRNQIFAMGMGVSGVIVILAIVISTSISRPLKLLSSSASIIASGDLSQQVEVSSHDEIGELANSFNHMAQALQERNQKLDASYHELEEYKNNLEEKVKERTAELEHSNQELRQTHEQLLQQERLASLGQLAAGVSHELKNPIWGILGLSQDLLGKMHQEELGETTPGEVANYIRLLSQIEKAAQRCETVVANMLRFSRASWSEEFKPLDVNQLLEDILLLTNHQLRVNRVKVEKELSPNLPQIKGNKDQLQQVFTNLIINAQQAITDGGKLTISTMVNGGAMEIVFADTGCGILKENLSKIFDPFFTTKPMEQGTGLGLSISCGIIREHKGELSVQSELGKGTIFIIRLPITFSHKEDGK